MMAFSPFSLSRPASAQDASAGSAPSLRFGPGDPVALAALEPLHQSARPGLPPLTLELNDMARAYGQQAMVAWRGDVPVGCLGWVSLELTLAGNGRLYGAPLLAVDSEVATGLITQLLHIAHRLAASHVRVSAWAAESAKAAALLAAGFQCQFEWVTFAIDTASVASPDFALAGYYSVPLAQLDWDKAVGLYNAAFLHVPNAPPSDALSMADDWAKADWDASCMLADAAGQYRAFVLINDGRVEAVGVDDDLRGSGLATQLYHYAMARLALRGVGRLKALVASTNLASMRFHQKLGFSEDEPRGAVYEMAL